MVHQLLYSVKLRHTHCAQFKIIGLMTEQFYIQFYIQYICSDDSVNGWTEINSARNSSKHCISLTFSMFHISLWIIDFCFVSFSSRTSTNSGYSTKIIQQSMTFLLILFINILKFYFVCNGSTISNLFYFYSIDTKQNRI